MRNDFYQGIFEDQYLAHSAKGTTWSNHKYIKKVGNRYYYADENGQINRNQMFRSRRQAETQLAMYDKAGDYYKRFGIETVGNAKVAPGKFHSNAMDYRNARYGANGMPSNVAVKLYHDSSKELDASLRKEAKRAAKQRMLSRRAERVKRAMRALKVHKRKHG